MATAKTTLGTVAEELPNMLYRVEFPDGVEKICHLAGKMKLNKIRVFIGDRVEVIIDPYGGKTSNRIVFRKK